MTIWTNFSHGAYYAFIDGELWRISSFSCKQYSALAEILKERLYL